MLEKLVPDMAKLAGKTDSGRGLMKLARKACVKMSSMGCDATREGEGVVSVGRDSQVEWSCSTTSSKPVAKRCQRRENSNESRDRLVSRSQHPQRLVKQASPVLLCDDPESQQGIWRK